MTAESPPTSTARVAYDALNLAKQNARDIENHEEICAERYAGIHASMGEIKNILKWAGGTLFSIIISLLAWLALQQFNANDQARKSAETKIELLEKQIAQQARPAPAASPQP